MREWILILAAAFGTSVAEEAIPDVTRAELETRSMVIIVHVDPERSVVVGARLPGVRVCLALPGFSEIVALEEGQDRVLWTARIGDGWSRLRFEEWGKDRVVCVRKADGEETLILEVATGTVRKRGG